MSKRISIAVWLLLGVLLCLAFASLLAAEDAVGPFHITSHDPPVHEVVYPLFRRWKRLDRPVEW
jgi:hypothetical protein